MTEQTSIISSNLAITKERVKNWAACTDGYRWFLGKFPQGGEFSEVYAALREDTRYNDADWLVEKVFAELGTAVRVQQTVKITGADASVIHAFVEANSATTGNYANSATTGNCANSATTGNYANSATTGEGAVSAALGVVAFAKASAGGAIVVVARDNLTGALLAIRASKVGENGVKPDTWYSLTAAGEFVERAAL